MVLANSHDANAGVISWSCVTKHWERFGFHDAVNQTLILSIV